MKKIAANAKHSTESVEHYTPRWVVDGARTLMGGIDLDPASCAKANKYIRAAEFYTKRSNGLTKSWHGRVFLNPPGGLVDGVGRPVINAKKGVRPSCRESGACGLPPGHTHEDVTSSAKFWWERLSREYMFGAVTQAVFIGFSLELLQTTQQTTDTNVVVPLQFPCCYPRERIKFLRESEEGTLEPGEQPTHANVLVYLPFRWDAAEKKVFRSLFGEAGYVTWPDRKILR